MKIRLTQFNLKIEAGTELGKKPNELSGHYVCHAARLQCHTGSARTSKKQSIWVLDGSSGNVYETYMGTSISDFNRSFITSNMNMNYLLFFGQKKLFQMKAAAEAESWANSKCARK